MAEEKLSDSYHRARRMFALLCGILIVWEYVGIEVGGKPADSSQSRDTIAQVDSAVVSDSQALFETAVDAIAQRTDTTTARLDSQPLDTAGATEVVEPADSREVSAGSKSGGVSGTMPIVGIPVTFRNPEVIPTAIFILVLYFAFRFTVEWRQCPETIRDKRTTSVDAGVAYAIGLAAVALFVVQRITELRLAEGTGTINLLGSFFGGLTTAGLSLLFNGYLLRSPLKHLRRPVRGTIGVLLGAGVSAGLAIVVFGLITPHTDLMNSTIIACFIMWVILTVGESGVNQFLTRLVRGMFATKVQR